MIRSIFVLLLGMKVSRLLYKQIEGKHGNWTRSSFRTICTIVFVMYLIPLRQPVMYLMFGHPEASDWFLPHGYR